MRLFDLAGSSGHLKLSESDEVWLFTDGDEIGSLYPVVDRALRQRTAYKLFIAVPPLQISDLRRKYPYEQFVGQNLRDKLDCTRRPKTRIQILGVRYHHLFGAGSRELKVDEGTNSEVILDHLFGHIPKRYLRRASILPSLISKLTAGSRIRNLDDLKHRLGAPRHILCLGNGPSSEDARLQSVLPECLFRVNWIWQERGVYLSPHLVFTADQDLPIGRPKPILAFPNETRGLPVLLRHCLRFQPPRQGYLFAEDVLPTLKDHQSDFIPSNGAIMIAVAAALQPKCLTIAGIDLYSHEEGRYPGDDTALDGYSRDHSRRTDLDFIRTALESYKGKLNIIGEALSKGIAESSATPSNID